MFVLFFAFGALILSSFPSGLVRSFRCNVWREVLLPRRYHVPESLSCVQHGIWKARPAGERSHHEPRRIFTRNCAGVLDKHPSQRFVNSQPDAAHLHTRHAKVTSTRTALATHDRDEDTIISLQLRSLLMEPNKRRSARNHTCQSYLDQNLPSFLSRYVFAGNRNKEDDTG